MSRRRRILNTIAAVLAALVLALGWLLGTTSGLRFALARAQQFTGGALSVQQARGRLGGTFTLEGLRFHVARGPDVRAARVQLQLRAQALLIGRVHIHALAVRQLDVALPSGPSGPGHAAGAFDPRAPVHLRLDRVSIDGLRVHRGKQTLFRATHVALGGSWSRASLAIRALRVQAPEGRLDLAARLRLGLGYPGHAKATFDWQAAGRRWKGLMEARSAGHRVNARVTLARPSTTQARVTLSMRAPHAWTANLSLPRGAAAPWLGTGHGIGQLAASLKAHGDAHQVHATGTLDIDAHRVALTALDARLAPGTRQLDIERLQLRSPPHAGSLDASGQVDLAPAQPTARLQLAWKQVTLPAALAGRALGTQGTLAIEGSLASYLGKLDARAGPPGRPAQVKARLTGAPGQLRVDTLTVQQAKGRLQAHGELRYGAGMQWQLALRARDFDPGWLAAGWDGALDATLSSHGALRAHDVRAGLDLGALSGTLRGHRLEARGTLSLSDKVLSGTMDMRYGSGRLAFRGASGARNNLDVTWRIDALADWFKPARGAVSATTHVTGSWPHLAVKGHLDASQLDWHGQRAARLSLRVDVPDLQHPGGKLDLSAGDLHAGGFAFKHLALKASGRARSHHLDVRAEGDPLSVRMALSGAFENRRWNGRLGRLDLTLAGHQDWHLEAPVAMAYGKGTASLGQTCLTAGQPRLCLAGSRAPDGSLTASYRMRQMPLELPLALAGNDLPMRAEGTLDGTGDVRRDAKGALSGQASLQSVRGSVFYLDQPHQPLLDFRHLDARLDLLPSGQQLRVSAALQHTGSLDARIQVQGPRHAMDGHVRVHLDNLRFVELFTPQVANLDGHLQADLGLAGTLGQPSVHGQAAIDGLAGELPALGLKLDQGQLRISGDQASALQLRGRVHSGKGMLEIAGTIGLGTGGTSDLTLRGHQVLVANIPSATVSLSPDVRLAGNARGLHVQGQVDVDRADVNLEKLPGAGATQASPDVVVVDARKPGPSRNAALPVTTDVRVQLGQHAHVTGYGLNGNLHGGLRVTTRPAQPALGQGQINIDGTFSAYGQDLTITRGQLLFASSPLDNPGLDMRAVRKLNPNATVDNGQEVGLEVRGTARRPQLTVFSNPAMDQSDALSYLITGKPLSQVKGGEGSMVDSAAQALGSATGNLLAKSIGSRLGISDIGVSSNDVLGTTAFTVGKYLSPRLYLSYGVGLFQPGQVVTLRYLLSRRWSFEAQQSTESSRASFNYRYEH